MRRPCPDLVRGFGVALLALLFVAPALAQDHVDLSPRDLAVVRINIIDLLVNEPRLPLPIKQRRDVLRTYYEEQSGDLLWLNTARAGAMVSRLTNATDDGLNPDDYPGRQLAGLMAAAGDTDKRSLAIIELYFSAAFLEYASDLKVGRFLPTRSTRTSSSRRAASTRLRRSPASPR